MINKIQTFLINGLKNDTIGVQEEFWLWNIISNIIADLQRGTVGFGIVRQSLWKTDMYCLQETKEDYFYEGISAIRAHGNRAYRNR